jgi:serine/threonine-protein kinase HipA
MPGLRGQVENEHFCLLLARALDFPSSNSSVLQFSDEVCIVVERYDRLRETPENEYVRLHQEDMCQALSVMPALKHQRDGGPSIKHVVHLLRDNSSAALEDMRQFLRAMAMNFVILGTDAHAKNFSVLIAPGRSRPQIRLAPLYDVNSYLPYTDGTQRIRMSMSVGGKYEYDEVAPRHWERESRSCGLPVDQTLADIRDVIARCPDAAADVALRCRESGLTHPVVGQLTTRIAARCVGLSRLYGKEAAADAQERLAIPKSCAQPYQHEQHHQGEQRGERHRNQRRDQHVWDPSASAVSPSCYLAAPAHLQPAHSPDPRLRVSTSWRCNTSGRKY